MKAIDGLEVSGDEILSKDSFVNKAIIFGHADADGHLAAIQSAENLRADNIDVLDIVVHPAKTRNYKFWEGYFQDCDFKGADIVVVVDIMFHPTNHLRSYEALISRVSKTPTTNFVVIDHHPVHDIPKVPNNLDLKFVSDVFNCCYGKPTDLMVIAAICDKDEASVKSRITDLHRKRAIGIKRAVSDRYALVGGSTLRLIEDRAWGVFEQLADEPAAYHRTFYGNRVAKKPESPLLQLAHAVRCSG